MEQFGQGSLGRAVWAGQFGYHVRALVQLCARAHVVCEQHARPQRNGRPQSTRQHIDPPFARVHSECAVNQQHMPWCSCAPATFALRLSLFFFGIFLSFFGSNCSVTLAVVTSADSDVASDLPIRRTREAASRAVVPRTATATPASAHVRCHAAPARLDTAPTGVRASWRFLSAAVNPTQPGPRAGVAADEVEATGASATNGGAFAACTASDCTGVEALVEAPGRTRNRIVDARWRSPSIPGHAAATIPHSPWATGFIARARSSNRVSEAHRAGRPRVDDDLETEKPSLRSTEHRWSPGRTSMLRHKRLRIDRQVQGAHVDDEAPFVHRLRHHEERCATRCDRPTARSIASSCIRSRASSSRRRARLFQRVRSSSRRLRASETTAHSACSSLCLRTRSTTCRH